MEDEVGPVTITYELRVNNDHLNRDFSDHEKRMLRPIAETLAMLDGNAFFTMTAHDGKEWYEQYLPEAYALFKGNGGMKGWAANAAGYEK
jgi:hypothetical protein